MNFDNKFKATYTEDKLPEIIEEKYSIASCLKHSGEKQVYLIKDRLSGTEYILKCAEGEYIPRLRKEYAILEKVEKEIRCPKPVSYTEIEGKGCLVREYIKGETIKEIVDKQPFSKAQTYEAISKIGKILDILHNLEPPVILRDIKPENIMISNDEYILIDFDAAREFNENASADTEFIGTRATAAPEQFGYSQTDNRTDIYSVGMLMTYMLTGGYNSSEVNDNKYRKIIKKCTQFSPNNRYRNMKAVCGAMNNKAYLYAGISAAIVVFIAGGFITAEILTKPKKSDYVMSPTNTYTFTEQAGEYSAKMVSDALACIDRQNNKRVRADKTKEEMVDYLLKDSRYAVFGGEEWPAISTEDISYYVEYVNDTALEPIDGTTGLKLDSLSSASMSVGWFVSGVIYTEEISLESYRVYPDGNAGEYNADTLKSFFSKYLQAGEHIRIDETRSMSFISCDDNGFYFIEYGSDDNSDRFTRLRYYTFQDFVNYLNPLEKQMWYYEVDNSVNY